MARQIQTRGQCREVFHLYVEGKKDAGKELAHTVGAGQFEIRMAGQQAANSQAGVKAAGQRQNVFFLWETLVLLLRLAD